MLLKVLRFATVMTVGFAMGATIGHLLEMPAKMKYPPALWLELLKTLYPPAFGPIAGPVESLATVLSVVLAIIVRKRVTAFQWTILGAAAMVIAHVAFWVLIAPVNSVMLQMDPHGLQENWTNLRNQWEYTHASRAILHLIALGALTWSFLVDGDNETRSFH